MFGPGGIKLGFGGDESGASPNMLVMIAAKNVGKSEVNVHFRFVIEAVDENDFVQMAATVLKELQLRAAQVARADGREPTQLGRFGDRAIDIALDNGKAADQSAAD